MGSSKCQNTECWKIPCRAGGRFDSGRLRRPNCMTGAGVAAVKVKAKTKMKVKVNVHGPVEGSRQDEGHGCEQELCA